MEYGGIRQRLWRRCAPSQWPCAWLPKQRGAKRLKSFGSASTFWGPMCCRDTKHKQLTDEPGDGKVGAEAKVLVQSHSRRCTSRRRRLHLPRSRCFLLPRSRRNHRRHLLLRL